MAGSPKLPRWQQTSLDAFNEVKLHPDFKEDMSALCEVLNSYGGRYFHLSALRLLRKYNAPRGVVELFKQYAIGDTVDPSSIDPPIHLISEADGTLNPSPEPKWSMEAYQEYRRLSPAPRVLLDISGEVQRKDIDDYLDLYFSSMIEPKLRLIEGSRPGSFQSKRSEKTHYRVIQLYKDKKQATASSRKVYREIEIETGQSLATIKKILQAYRNQKKWDIKLPPYDVAT